MVLRPSLPPEREGWLYAAALLAAARELGGEVRIEWPDELRRAGTRIGAVGIQAGLGPVGVEWAVATVALLRPDEARAPLIARLASAVEAALEQHPEELLPEYLSRCVSIGRTVRVRLAGVGADVGTVSGSARAVRADGALSIENENGRGVAVLPGYLRAIEYDPTPTPAPGLVPPPGG